jgi:hypothetical protein
MFQSTMDHITHKIIKELKMVLPSDIIPISVCVSALCDVITMMRSLDNAFLRVYPHG